MKKIISSVFALSAVFTPMAVSAQDAGTETFYRLAQMVDQDDMYYRFEYDSEDRVVKIEELTLDRAYNEYTYDSKGQCVRESTWQEIPVSSGKYYNVGMVDYTYDEQGRMATRANSMCRNASDPASVMELQAVAYYSYDAEGRIHTVEYFWGADKLSRIQTNTYVYGEDGKLEKELFTTFNSANQELYTDEAIHTYGEDGRILKTCNMESDIDNGYKPVARSWVNYVYDEDGNLVERYKTGMTDSPANKQQSVTYTVDDNVPANRVIYPSVPESYYGDTDWKDLRGQLVVMDEYVFDLDSHESALSHSWNFDYDEVERKAGIGSVETQFGKSLICVTVSGDMLSLHGVAGAENVRIFDLNGRCVRKFASVGNTVNVGGLAGGVYVISTSAGIAKFIR